MPRKNVTGFPGKAERERLMKELQKADDPDLRPFAEALTTLDDAMRLLETPKPPHGLAKTLKAKDKDSLMAAILTAANAGEAYLAAAEKAGKDMTKGLPALAEELQSLLSVNYDALARYQPDMGLSLPELQQAARTVTVDARGVKLDAGGAPGGGLRMTVTDADGARRRGFFTGQKRVDLLTGYRAALRKARLLCKNNQTASEALKNFLQTYGQQNRLNRGEWHVFRGRNKLDIDPSLSEEDALTHLIAILGRPYPEGSAKNILSKAGLDTDNIPEAAIDAMDEAFAAASENYEGILSVKELRLQDGARLDDRSVSMCAVADLLGVSGLLVRSTPMRCVDQDGKLVEGTFTEEAKGEFLTENPDRFAKTSDSAAELFADGEGSLFQDLLDLQVLDYLCGNVDRDEGSIAFRLNDRGQIVGLQAAKNESAFGLFKGEKEGRNLMHGLDDVRLMSQSMYERIKATTPEMLKLALRGTGRSPEEIQFACERLGDLKQLIEEKKPKVWEPGTVYATNLVDGLHVVPDAELRKLHPRNLSLLFKNTLGASVIQEVSEKHKTAKQKGETYKRAYYEATKLVFDKKPESPELGTDERKFTAGGLGDSLREVSALYKNEATGRFIVNDTGYWRRSSGPFRDMVRAAGAAAKIQKDLAQRLSRDPDKEKLLRSDPKLSGDKKEADDAVDLLSKRVDDYLARKRDQRGVESDEELVQNAKNDYERERIRYALSLKQAVQNYRNLDDPNVQAETHGKETAQAVLQTAQNRKAAQEAAGPAAHN